MPLKQIFDSSHPAVVPLNAPISSVRYDPLTMDPKKRVTFTRPVWTQFDIFVRLNPEMSDLDWERAVSSSSLERKLALIESKFHHEKGKRGYAENIYQSEKKNRKEIEKLFQNEKLRRQEAEKKFREQKERSIALEAKLLQAQSPP
jgi:hypothetical protein